MSAQPEFIPSHVTVETKAPIDDVGDVLERAPLRALEGGASETSPAIGDLIDISAESGPSVLNKLDGVELNILGLAGLGFKNTEIAEKMNLTPDVIKKTLDRIYRVFSVGSRAQAGYVAKKEGLFQLALADAVEPSQDTSNGLGLVREALIELGMDKNENYHTISHLTEVERGISELLARGIMRAGIAANRGISVHKVKYYQDRIYRKLGLHSQAEAVARIFFTDDGRMLLLSREDPLDRLEREEEAMNEDKLNQGDIGPQIAQAKAIEADIEAQLGKEIDATVKAVLGQPGAEGKSVDELSFPMTNENMLMELVDKNFAPIDAIDTKQIGVNGLVAAIMMTRSNKKSLFFDNDTLPYARNVLIRRVASHSDSEESQDIK